MMHEFLHIAKIAAEIIGVIVVMLCAAEANGENPFQ
jgi:hypothetical protein